MGGDQMDIATAANQVLLSMGFVEDEITVQVAGLYISEHTHS